MIPQSRIDFIAKQIELNGKAEFDLKSWRVQKHNQVGYANILRDTLYGQRGWEMLTLEYLGNARWRITLHTITTDLLTWEPTMKLRYQQDWKGIHLESTPTLQQLWTNGKEEEWRDVEVQEE